MMYSFGLLLVLSCPSSSIATLCSVTNLCRPEGTSVFVNMGNESRAAADISVVEWYNNDLIMRYYPGNKLVVQPMYKSRVKFDKDTFSLELMNLQKKDSGVYVGVIIEKERGTICAAKYKLSVVEPVAAPVLTVVSNRSSSDSCNVTLNCKGHDLSLDFSCNSSDCIQLGDLPITPALVVFAKDGHIICNHSNQVSWNNVTLEMSSLCEITKGKDSTFWIPLTIGLISIGVTVAVCLLIYTYQKQKNKQKSKGASVNIYVPVPAQTCQPSHLVYH